MAKPDTWQEYMTQVLESTSELFYLLEAADQQLKADLARGTTISLDRGFGPSTVSLCVGSRVLNRRFTLSQEFGPDGRLAQLAYKGWIAAVDGAWERFRKKPPYEQSDGLQHGMQADLFGDLHRMRNDLLKNRGVAQRKNTGRCVVLKWFEPGAKMHLTLDHVFDFLHGLGRYVASYIASDGRLLVDWYIRDRPAVTRHRVVSTRVFVERFPPDSGEPGFELFVSMVFSDGIPWVVLARRADDQADLADDREALAQAPLDQFGVPVHPDLGPLNVPAIYQIARADLQRGGIPVDPGSPWMQFREKPSG